MPHKIPPDQMFEIQTIESCSTDLREWANGYVDEHLEMLLAETGISGPQFQALLGKTTPTLIKETNVVEARALIDEYRKSIMVVAINEQDGVLRDIANTHRESKAASNWLDQMNALHRQNEEYNSRIREACSALNRLE